MAESEEELKSLLMKVKVESENVGLTPAACSFPGENARSWEALGPAIPSVHQHVT